MKNELEPRTRELVIELLRSMALGPDRDRVGPAICAWFAEIHEVGDYQFALDIITRELGKIHSDFVSVGATAGLDRAETHLVNAEDARATATEKAKARTEVEKSKKWSPMGTAPVDGTEIECRLVPSQTGKAGAVRRVVYDEKFVGELVPWRSVDHLKNQTFDTGCFLGWRLSA